MKFLWTFYCMNVTNISIFIYNKHHNNFSLYPLVSSFLRSSEKLLLWSAVCFCLLALNNLLVFLDIIILPDLNLTLWRSLTSLAAVSVLLYGFIWEIE